MTRTPPTDLRSLHEKLRPLAVNARTEQATWWLWDDERDYGPMLAFGHAANPEAITDLCDEIERLTLALRQAGGFIELEGDVAQAMDTITAALTGDKPS